MFAFQRGCRDTKDQVSSSSRSGFTRICFAISSDYYVGGFVSHIFYLLNLWEYFLVLLVRGPLLQSHPRKFDLDLSSELHCCSVNLNHFIVFIFLALLLIWRLMLKLGCLINKLVQPSLYQEGFSIMILSPKLCS